MEEVYNYMKQNLPFFLATVDGDQPRVRPFGAIDLFEGKIYTQTGNVKNVFKQMTANPKVELCAMGKDGATWLRVEAEVVRDDRLEARQHMLDANPVLKKMYAADDGNCEVVWLKNAVATFYSFTAAPRTVKF